MINNVDSLSRSISQHDEDHPTSLQDEKKAPNYSSSCSSLTSGIGQSDHSICIDKGNTSSATCAELDHQELRLPRVKSADLKNIDEQLKQDIKKFVDDIFTNSQSITLEKKAEFGLLVRTTEARLLFAMFVDDYRVNSKRVSELTFYSLAQYFSIVLFECLQAEDFRPAKIIMNMMFTYYYEQNFNKIPPRDRPVIGGREVSETDSVKTYLYTLLKDQEIFKSIRFWTSAFYETVIIERSNHPVFVDRGQGKLSNEKRDEELDCSKNITFGLLGSFIYNMSLLDLSHEFCQEFLDKHSTIAGLSDDQLEMLRANMKSMFIETSDTSTASTSTSERLSHFLQKLSTKLNQASTQAYQHR